MTTCMHIFSFDQKRQETELRLQTNLNKMHTTNQKTETCGGWLRHVHTAPTHTERNAYRKLSILP